MVRGERHGGGKARKGLRRDSENGKRRRSCDKEIVSKTGDGLVPRSLTFHKDQVNELPEKCYVTEEAARLGLEATKRVLEAAKMSVEAGRDIVMLHRS